MSIDRISRPVIQLTLKGKTIKEFPSIRNAQEALDINRYGIREVCKGNRKSAGGFKWKFKEEKNNDS